MYLRFARRRKDGKEHRYWSIVESRRCAGGRVVQRPVLYLGEINDSQHAAWCRVIEAFDEGSGRYRQLALFAAERSVPEQARGFGVQVRLDAMELHRPRQWGACWVACHLYEELQLDRFFAPLLPPSREGTGWQHILQTLVCYRLIDPGSEWRLHRQWFEASAMADLLGEDYGLVEKNALYRCLDKLLPHKAALFSHLRARWQDLFAATFDVLLYDLTSTYFESPPPEDEADKRRHGYSRDKRSDCVQVVIALVVTPDGFPLGYEVLPGNTADCTTLRDMLRKVEVQYGKANRIWVMDRGIPSEEVLAEMRAASPPVSYWSAPPRAAVQAGEAPRDAALADRARGRGREALAASFDKRSSFDNPSRRPQARIHKERAMRLRKLKWLWGRLKEIAAMELPREELLMKLGAARARARAAWRLVDVDVAQQSATFTFTLDRAKLRQVRQREGRYLLRTNPPCQCEVRHLSRAI
jgi:Transposase DDE domain